MSKYTYSKLYKYNTTRVDGKYIIFASDENETADIWDALNKHKVDQIIRLFKVDSCIMLCPENGLDEEQLRNIGHEILLVIRRAFKSGQWFNYKSSCLNFGVKMS